MLLILLSSDRQTKTRTETDIRTNGHTSRHTDRRVSRQKRGKTDKTETETSGRRQQTRIKRQDGKQRRWCGTEYTATRAAVMVGGWLCGGRVVLLCVGGGVVLLFVLCLCLSCWGMLSGGRLPSPPLRWRFASLPLKWPRSLTSGGTRHPGAQDTRSNTGGQHWARWCKTCVFNVCLHDKLNQLFIYNITWNKST